MAPVKVQDKDQDSLWTRMYSDGNRYLKQFINRMSIIIISRSKGRFRK